MLKKRIGAVVLMLSSALLGVGCAAAVSPEDELVESAEQALSESDGAGWTASKATYATGAFVQLNQRVWIENNADGHHAFEEVARDQWSVYLRATDRANVNVQLDFWTKEVKYQGPGYTTPVVLHKLTTADRVSGWAAHRVVYQNGAYVQLDATTWVENNGHGLHTFTESARDEWSVYLRATDRANVYVQLDLWTMKIYYEAPGTGRLELAPVQTAEPQRLGGWSAREVLYSTGRFTQTGTSSWSEVNRDGTHLFRELGRDEWSVYLASTNRANVYIQLDLWTLQVKYRGPGYPNSIVLYGVTGAR